jgi:excisionase family DNA binding protein
VESSKRLKPRPEVPSAAAIDSFASTTEPESLEAQFADREVLNVDEVADLLRVEERLVYDSVKRNEIPGVRRFGKRGIIRVSRRVFFDWLHGRES